MQVWSRSYALKLLAMEARAWELSLFFCTHNCFFFTIELRCKGDQEAFSYIEDSLQWRSRRAIALATIVIIYHTNFLNVCFTNFLRLGNLGF
jgi:hypothetical protein